jgi:hypothetical protein
MGNGIECFRTEDSDGGGHRNGWEVQPPLLGSAACDVPMPITFQRPKTVGHAHPSFRQQHINYHRRRLPPFLLFDSIDSS